MTQRETQKVLHTLKRVESFLDSLRQFFGTEGDEIEDGIHEEVKKTLLLLRGRS